MAASRLAPNRRRWGLLECQGHFSVRLPRQVKPDQRSARCDRKCKGAAMNPRAPAEQRNPDTLPGRSQQVRRDPQHLALFQRLQISRGIIDCGGMLGPDNGLRSKRPVPVQLAGRPLCGRNLPDQHHHRMAASDHAPDQLMARPVRRRKHHPAALGHGLVEHRNRGAQVDVADHRRPVHAVMKRGKRIGEEPPRMLEIEPRGLLRHIPAERKAHVGQHLAPQGRNPTPKQHGAARDG